MQSYRTHEDSPLTTIMIEQGAVVVTMDFDLAGAYTKLHSHSFDHWMECVKGSARIVIDSVQSVIRPSDKYLVEAHKEHEVFPLESGTILRCVHEHSDIHPDNTLNGIPLEWLDRLTDTKNA